MPRTPRAQEFTPQATPSSVALSSPQTGVFSAIAQGGAKMQAAGARMAKEEEDLQAEIARTKDNLAAREFSNEVRLSQQKWSNDLAEAKTDDERNAVAQARADHFQEFVSNADVSDDTRALLQTDADFQTAASQEMARGANIAALSERQKSAAKASYGLAVNLLDVDALEDSVNEMDEAGMFGSPEEKALAFAKGKSAMQSQESSEFALNIQAAEGLTQLDAQEELINASDILDTKNKNNLKKGIEIRKRGIKSAAYTEAGRVFKLHRDNTHEVITGQVRDTGTLENRGLDPSYIDSVLNPIIEGQSGDTGIGSEQYNDAIKGMQKFIRDGDVWDDLTPKEQEKFAGVVGNEAFTFDARLRAGALMTKALKADASDYVLGTAAGDIKLDEGQKTAVDRMQSQVFEAIRNSRAKLKEGDEFKVTFENSLLDPDQMVDLFDQFSSEEVLNQLKGLEGKELDDKYEEVITPRITGAIKASIQSQYKETLEAMKPPVR